MPYRPFFSRRHATETAYPVVKTWDQLVKAVRYSSGCTVASEIHVDSPQDLEGVRGGIKFTPDGALELSVGDRVNFDLPLLNADNHQIFNSFWIDEDYPERWNGCGAQVQGHFGNNSVRDPRWWGLEASTNPNIGNILTAERNVDALVGAALSRVGQKTVLLPEGKYNVGRSVRLDGLRCTLKGQGMSASQLWAHSDRYSFDVEHKIMSEEFFEGTTPVVEIGYERQPDGGNPDEGFFSAVEGVGVICPLYNHNRVSGIMWSGCGLQEGSYVRSVAVRNHSGIGIGGPRRQTLELNGVPQGYYMQLNGFRGDCWWIVDPNSKFEGVLGVSIGGITYQISNATIDMGRGDAAVQTRPAIIAGARENGLIQGCHIEHSPPTGQGVGILVPNDNGLLQRMNLLSNSYLPSAPHRQGVTHRTIRLENSRGSVTCIGNTFAGSERLGRAVEDAVRGKTSEGYHYQTASCHTNIYAREHQQSGHKALSTDPTLSTGVVQANPTSGLNISTT